MAGIYVKNVEDSLKEWLKKLAKAEGFSTLSGYIKVHFTQLRAVKTQEDGLVSSSNVMTGRIENSNYIETLDKVEE